MLPSYTQFRRWAYPSKFAFVSFFIALSLSVAFWLFPDTGKQLVARINSSGQDKVLVGTWKGVMNCESPRGDVIASGYTRLLSSGEYSYSGEVEIRTKGGMGLQYTALAAGTWKATEDGFVLTALDMKTTPHLLKQSGKSDVDLTDILRQLPQQLLPRLEDLMPRGSSQEYAIVEITARRLRARGSDIRGNAVTYEATRQSSENEVLK